MNKKNSINKQSPENMLLVNYTASLKIRFLNKKIKYSQDSAGVQRAASVIMLRYDYSNQESRDVILDNCTPGVYTPYRHRHKIPCNFQAGC